MKNPEVTRAIYNKHVEIHYNEKTIRLKDGKEAKIELQGKIKCPVLNQGVSSIVCAKLMDIKDWPRQIDPDVCKKANCFVNMSIQKFQRGKDGKRGKKLGYSTKGK